MSDRSVAEEWLARAAGKWRLQVLQKRGRNMPSTGAGGWVRRGLPLRVRRFLNGTPVGVMHDVMRILDGTTEIPEDSLFNREPAETPSAGRAPNFYNPVRTYIVKDGNPNESNGRDPTYTIVQDLRLAGDEGDGVDGLPTDMSCSQDTSTSYVWDAPDVSVPPDLAYGQGVSYRVSNVVRDSETDLFSYQLQEQVAVTQHQPPVVTECTEFEKVTVESWDGLYGNVGSLAGRFFDNGASRTGDVASMEEVVLPAPCSQPDGTTVRVQVQESPDCTFRVTVETRVAKTDVKRQSETRKTLKGVTETVTVVATSRMSETGLALGEQVRNELRPDGLFDVTHVTVSPKSVGDVGSECGTTVFEHRHSSLRNEADRPEREADRAGGGETYEVRSRATDEGTWDVTRSVVREIESRGARVRKRKTLRGVTETVTHRNVQDPTVSVSAIGDEVEVERTPGGLWNRTETRVSAESVGNTGAQCSRTVFEHEHSVTENVANRPDAEVSSSGGGVVRETSVRATEEGTWDVTRKTVEEMSVPVAQKTVRKTLRGVVETVVSRNGTDGSASVSRIGDEVRVEMTPGGRYNRTVTHVSATSVGDVGSDCETTVFEHRHSDLQNVPSRPGKESAAAGGGKTYQVRARATDEGTWDVTTTTVTENPVTSAQKTVQKTLRGIITTTTDRNVDNSSVAVANVGDRVQVEKTPGGRYNRTVTSVSATSVGDVGSDCETTVFEHRHSTSRNVALKPDAEAAGAGDGKTHRVQARATDEGTWDVVDTVTSEVEAPQSVHVMRKTLRGVTETTVDRNVSDSSVSVTAIGDEVRVERTPGGRWNRTVTRVSPESVGTTGKSCSSTAVVHTDTTVSNVSDGSQPDPMHQSSETNVERSVEIRRTDEGSWDVTNRVTTYKPWADTVVMRASNPGSTVDYHAFQNVDNPPAPSVGNGQTLSGSVTRNRVGSFDGEYRVVTAKPFGPSLVGSTSGGVVSSEIYVFQNVSSAPTMAAADGEAITAANVSRNEFGLFDGGYRKARAKPFDSGWLKWDSTTKTPNGTYKYHHGLRIFKNQKTPPTEGVAGSSVQVQASVNEFGLYDGQLTYTELAEWTQGGNGGGSEGGSEGGTVTLMQFVTDSSGKVYRRSISVHTRAYHGTGNEGSEASAKANQIMVQGLSLPSRTYATGIQSYGKWEQDG